MIFSSARISEHNTIDGTAGDQTKKEVCSEPFYVHELGWYVFEPLTKGAELANKMLAACENDNIGYSQKKRLDIIKDHIDSTKPTSCDCSSLVRECIIETYGYDIGNVSTAGAPKALDASGLFKPKYKYEAGELPVGSVLVSCKKGHTGIITATTAKAAAPAASAKIETTVAAKSKDTSLKGTYITTGRLYMRKSPGTGSVMCTMPARSEVKMYGFYTLRLGVKWFRASYTGQNGTQYIGFCSERYLIRKE